MPQYIDREKIKLNSLSWIDGDGDILVPLVEVRKAIAQTPAEDVVAVVRCADCKYLTKDKIADESVLICNCSVGMINVAPYSFCSYGERKEK